ncbi:IS110 family transposase, partial [Nocardioides bigeumensis]|uniref:IS110 family transposase n=1 Tax=Nocardioides bigeumensis TaxID=433657 RepID=UPI0031D6F2EA
MFTERTSVGLDVHARSVVATAIDTTTGELFKERLIPSNEIVLDWLARLSGPVAVTYEAGPTGFGLARALTTAGIRCEVAAPSKLARPAGDRVKTDARDALQLAKLLRNDDITSVRVPTITQEAARDLVRAREDVRGDLMRARHRVSKLLLRHGHVYGGKTWSAKHHAWLHRIQFDDLGTRAAYQADLEAIEFAVARRDRLDAVITQLAADSEFTDITRRLCCLRGISTLTGFALAVEVGDWTRFNGNSIGAYLG